MFTGIIQAVGQIEQVERREPGVHVLVRSEPIGAASLNVGDSIAVNGCCLTVTAIDGGRFQADLSEETLARTANLDRCGPVNLELSLAVGDRIGGHLVLGHVDAVGTVVSILPAGDSSELRLRAPRSIAACLAFKGSLAVDGVSLTINRAQGSEHARELTITLIPPTLAAPTSGALPPPHAGKLQGDPLARSADPRISR